MATEKNKNLVIILAAVAIVAVVVLAMTAGGDTSNQLVTEEVTTEETIGNATVETTTTTTGEETPAANAVDAVEEGLTKAGNAIDNVAADVANEVGSAPENESPTDTTDSNSNTPNNAPVTK